MTCYIVQKLLMPIVFEELDFLKQKVKNNFKILQTHSWSYLWTSDFNISRRNKEELQTSIQITTRRIGNPSLNSFVYALSLVTLMQFWKGTCRIFQLWVPQPVRQSCFTSSCSRIYSRGGDSEGGTRKATSYSQLSNQYCLLAFTMEKSFPQTLLHFTQSYVPPKRDWRNQVT